jgi:hypothetical protein
MKENTLKDRIIAAGLNKNKYDYQLKRAKKDGKDIAPPSSSSPSIDGFCQVVQDYVHNIASEKELENKLIAEILAQEVTQMRSRCEQEEKEKAGILKLGVVRNAQFDKSQAQLQKLKASKKLLQQDKRRLQVRLATLKAAAEDYVSHKFAIDVLTSSDAEKFAALLKLAYDLIDKEVDNGDPRKLKSNQERYEEKETLKAVFCASYQNMGRCNKSGDKRGITRKINPRILCLALRLACSMSQTNYEQHRITSPYLPSWSTLVKYKMKVRNKVIYVQYTFLLLSLDLSAPYN